MVSIPDQLLKEIDVVAKKEHQKRSEFLKNLAIRYLEFKKRKKNKKELNHLLSASESSLSFWHNAIDDEIWNNH